MLKPLYKLSHRLFGIYKRSFISHYIYTHEAFSETFTLSLDPREKKWRQLVSTEVLELDVYRRKVPSATCHSLSNDIVSILATFVNINDCLSKYNDS